MMIGEVFRRHVPTVHIPNWEPDPSPYTTFSSPPSSNSCHYYTNTISIPTNEYSSPSRIPLSDYSPSSITDYAVALHHHYSPTSPRSSTSSTDPNQYDYDSFPSDSFRIYDFKVRRCVRGRSHDWTECPFAHPGEKARRRDPRKFHYSGTPCPDFRKGVCRKGDGCEFAHGVFECWLHPQRYRTQPCKDGIHCSRRVCFFAHTPEQLRLSSDDGPGSSPQGKMGFLNDQLENRNSGGFESVNELVGRMNDLHLQGMDGCGGGGGKAVVSPRCWGFQLSNSSVTTNSGGGGGGFGSPRSGSGLGSLQPSTPTQKGSVRGLFDTTGWSNLLFEVEEEPVIERVESGRDIRARMYAKLRGDNSLDRPESPFCPIPDFGWVSELVK